jgi:antirestriction protein ArdC
MHAQRIDLYTRITNQIIAELEAGVRPWIQPWEAAHAAGEVSRPLRFNGLPYRGINVVLLWLSALRQHFTCPLWMTYRQAAELGGQVRGGQKGSLVVYSDTFIRRGTDENGDEQEHEVPFLRSYTVFNAEQIDGLPAHYYARTGQTTHPVERIARAERFFASTGADIHHGGAMAYYAPARDFVQMPPFESFREEAARKVRAKTRSSRLSVGADRFDLTFTDIACEKVAFRSNQGLGQMHASMPRILSHAENRQRNVIVRPPAP